MTLRHATLADRPALEALQHDAYAWNKSIIGRDPMPLSWDYGNVLRDWEAWLAEHDGNLLGAIILHPRPDDLYIESIAVSPQAQGGGIGKELMTFAHSRAATLGRRTLRLLTNALFIRNIAWYEREGFSIERVEVLADRTITHMIKNIGRTRGDAHADNPPGL